MKKDKLQQTGSIVVTLALALMMVSTVFALEFEFETGYPGGKQAADSR